MPRTNPVLCDECGVIMSSMDALRKHKRRIHPIQVRVVWEATSSTNPSASMRSPLEATRADDGDDVPFGSFVDFLNESEDTTPMPVPVPTSSGDVVAGSKSVIEGTRDPGDFSDLHYEDLQAGWASLPALDFEASASALPPQHLEEPECSVEAVVGVERMADEWATQWSWDQFLSEVRKLWLTCPESVVRDLYLSKQPLPGPVPSVSVDWSPLQYEAMDCDFDTLLQEWQSY